MSRANVVSSGTQLKRMLADLLRAMSSRQSLSRLAVVVIIVVLVVTMFTSTPNSSPAIQQKADVVRVGVDHVKSVEDENAGTKNLKSVRDNELSDQKLKGTHVTQLKYLWDKSEYNNSVEQYKLQEGFVTLNVHYMWCGREWFEFRDYLSVLSVLRAILPDKVVIHYEYPPEVDKLFYHQWLAYLKHDFPYLVMEEMDDHLVAFCSADREEQVQFILQVLNQEGGIYVSHRTWLVDFAASIRSLDFEIALEPDSVDGYILLRSGMLKTPNTSYPELLNDTTLKTHQSQCAQVRHVFHGHTKGCIVVKGEQFDHFYPMDIWELDNAFGKLTRKMFYGIEEIRKPKPSYDELVPNIGHMVWIGGGKMDFVFYLSVLSMLYVVKVDVLYIHGEQPPSGPLWAKVNATPRIRDRLKLIKRTPPTNIFQGEIEPWYRALMSDLIRVDLMINYGGIYADTDAIWVKGLSHEDRGYDAVASYDWVDWSWPYPDSVNFGLSYGKKTAPFWQLFRDTMRNLHNDIHGFTGVMNPYKILERYPHLLRIDRHLQVICYEEKCHPIWTKDYHNMSRDHTTDHSLVNWKEDVNAFHWTFPNPKALANETTLRHSTGLFADVGKFVMEAAGLW